jgi:hypothetical protein
MEKIITISLKEYEDLKEAQMELDALQQAGVDNWEGYDDAMTLLEEMKTQDDKAEGED